MSGGHFDYIQYKLNAVETAIDDVIHDTDSHCCPGDDVPLTKTRLKLTKLLVVAAAAAIHRVDWWLSGDDGTDSFHKRWKEDDIDETIRQIAELIKHLP